MSEYQYRPMRRSLPDGEWEPVKTSGNGWGRHAAYKTRGAAQGVLTHQKWVDAKFYQRQRFGEYEYKIQRRPLGEWEDET